MKAAEENWIEEQCNDIDKGMMAGNSRKAYTTLKTLSKAKKPTATVIEDKEGKTLTESEEVLKRWTEYCESLYNHPLQPDKSILQGKLPSDQADAVCPPIMRREVEEAIKTLQDGKSPGVDNIPAEMLKYGGEDLVTVLTAICQKILDEKKWPQEWTQSLVIPLPKKGNLKLCQNYRTISLISHPSKIMLRILLNRLKAKSEEILAEEQAGFRKGRSTVEQIFNCRLLIEKYIQHQQSLFHNFIDFKKAFDRVWHEGLWHVLRSFNIEEGIVGTIEALYNSSSSAVLLNNQLGEFFRTTVGVRQGCILSPALFNLFLENIMQETLMDHVTTVSIGGRPLCNLRFADDIDLMGGSNAELQDLTDKLVNRAGAYGMEVSSEKSKVMVNSPTREIGDIRMNGSQLEEVETFKYLGATLQKDGTCSAEIRIRIATATAAMTKLCRVWKSNISLPTKFRLYRSLVLSTLLYGCESWTLTADSERRIQAFENKCQRRLLRVTWVEHKTNEYIHSKIKNAVGPFDPLLTVVKRRKLAWFGHVTRRNNLSKTILQGTVEGKRKRGRQKKSWMDNIKEWTGKTMHNLLSSAADREGWRKTVVFSSS